MAGHSKWKNIQHRKNKQDALRGSRFTQLIREITVSAKMGGVENNPRLRLAVSKALSANMTRDAIDRAIARASQAQESSHLEDMSYEGYMAGGVAVWVMACSDNRNRTASDVRSIFHKFGGQLGADGSVSYLFSKKGHLWIQDSSLEPQLWEWLLDEDIQDIESSSEGLVVVTAPQSLMTIHDLIRSHGVAIADADVVYIPQTTVTLDAESSATMLKFLQAMEQLDDVQSVHHHALLAEESP